MRKIISILFIFFSFFSFAQVGINTSNPQGVFNIDASKDNPPAGIPSATQMLNDISVSASGNLGVGTVSPQRKLHVNANSGTVRFENLASLPANTSSNSLVVDANGDIYKNNTVSVEGQILRVGLNASTYSTGQSALRFHLNNSDSDMGNAPNAAPNFINTIVGATITESVTVPAGQGSPSRTTDQITLQPGIYKVQVRLVGNFTAVNDLNSFFIKSIVNNNEYSLVNASNRVTGPSVYYFDDFINITGSAQTVDFTFSPSGSSFSVTSSATPGIGNSYRSLILIQKLR